MLVWIERSQSWTLPQPTMRLCPQCRTPETCCTVREKDRWNRWNYFLAILGSIRLFNPIWKVMGHPLPPPPIWDVSWLAARAAPLMTAGWPVFTVEKWTAGLHVKNICATGSSGHRSRELTQGPGDQTQENREIAPGRELPGDHRLRNQRLSTSSLFWQVAILGWLKYVWNAGLTYLK